MNSASYRTYRVGRGLIQMQDRKGSFCSYDEVSPLDETALVTAVSIPSSEAIGNLTSGAEDDWTGQNRGLSGDDSATNSIYLSSDSIFP